MDDARAQARGLPVPPDRRAHLRASPPEPACHPDDLIGLVHQAQAEFASRVASQYVSSGTGGAVPRSISLRWACTRARLADQGVERTSHPLNAGHRRHIAFADQLPEGLMINDQTSAHRQKRMLGAGGADLGSVTQRHPDGVDEVNSDYSINGACQSRPR